MINYGEMLKEHRLARGKTLLDIEHDTGISNANLSRWECGKNLPNIDFCVKLADFYGISLDELIGRDFIPNQRTNKSFNQNIKDNHGTINNKF